MTVQDFEALAKERLSSFAFRYFAAGTGEERTLRENVRAYARWRLVPGAAAAGDEPTTKTDVLGRPVTMPLLVGPISFQHVAHPEGDRATARSAALAGTIMCLSATSVTSPRELAAAVPHGRHWLQIQCFEDESLTQLLIDQAVEAGFEALVFTADTPYKGRRGRSLRRAAQLPYGVELPSWAILDDSEKTSGVNEYEPQPTAEGGSWSDDLRSIAGGSPLPILVKGILTVEDALLACDHGVAGIIVSNHGGRHVDDAPATLDVLPALVEAVGDRTEVLLDGGIRRGSDVVKALALGARAVLAGRAVIWGLASDGEPGVQRVLEILRDEISRALAEVGCPAPDAVTRTAVAAANADCREVSSRRC